jgi:hypothetical protein
VLAELKSKGSMRARSTSLRKQAIVELISHWKMPCTVHRSRTIGIGIQSYKVEQMSGLLSSFLDSVWSVTKTMDLRPWLTHAVPLALRRAFSIGTSRWRSGYFHFADCASWHLRKFALGSLPNLAKQKIE